MKELKFSECVRKPMVVAFNRDRDGYQVPLALEEAGWLEALVSDYYAPELGGFRSLKHRRHLSLPSGKTRSSFYAALLQLLQKQLNLNATDIFWRVDAAIGKAAAKVALESDADLLLYSRYAYEAFTDQRLQSRRKGLFVFHPHPKLTEKILNDDLERFPEFHWEFQDAIPAQRQMHREDVEIQQADFAITASTYTKHSLVHMGIDPNSIHVVPYGVVQVSTSREIVKPSGVCRFLFVGQGIHRKGLHHLLLAWQQAALPKAELTLVCHSIDPALLPLVARTGVVLLSKLPKNQLDEQFTKAHVLVLPSLVEGFGLVYLEAMAFGCYTIGTQNTGMPDLELTPSVGAIHKAGDIDALAVALTRAHELHCEGRLDSKEIEAFAGRWPWDRFRKGIRAAIAHPG